MIHRFGIFLKGGGAFLLIFHIQLKSHISKLILNECHI